MRRNSCELAATPGLGRVYDCGNCECMHLQVGPVSITLTRAAYLQFVELINRSAANFELMMEHPSAGPADHSAFGAVSGD